MWYGSACGNLQLRDALDLAENALRQRLYRAAAAGRLRYEILLVYAVEDREVIHVRDKAGGLEDFVIAASAGFKDRADIFAALVCLGFDAFRDLPCGWIDRDLARAVDGAAGNHALGIGSDCRRSFCGADNFHARFLLSLKQLWDACILMHIQHSIKNYFSQTIILINFIFVITDSFSVSFW